MRLLFLGDIVGRSGRNAVIDALPGLKRRYALDFVAINGENAAGGFGITEAILEELIEAGADAVTLGNHAFDQKEALGYFVDGRATAVIGTHTHAPTADDRVLPAGTAFMSDVGMCGDYNSVLGMDIEEPISRFLTKIPRQRFEPARGPATLSGLAVDIDDETGLARACSALRIGPNLEPAAPAFWSS